MRSLTTGLLASVWLFALTSATAAAQSNVLFVVVDDLGADSVACYGAGVRNVVTPNIDALAAGGVRFTRAYVNPACSPTRGCIMTGRHGFRTGLDNTVIGNEPGLNANERTLPMALQGTNYQNALIGKWHIGSRFGFATPNQFGWQHFAGTLDGGIPDYFRWPKNVNGQIQLCTNYATTDQVDDALTWINARTSPWLLMLSFCAPHQPFHVPPANLHTRDLGQVPTTNPQVLFEAMVESVDTEIGRLLGSLPASVRANTNIILLGDNGTDGALAIPPEQPTRMKGSMYEGGIRVPLIVNGPAVQQPGRQSSALVAAVDLFATVLDLCGLTPAQINASPAGPIDGVSMRPLLANTASSIRSYVYIDMIYGIYGGGYAVVDDTYSLLRILYNGQQRQELYRLDTDPMQTNNLRSSTMVCSEPAAYQRLTNILASIRQDGWSETVGWPCNTGTIAPSMRAQNFPSIGQLFVPQLINAPMSCPGLLLSAGFTTSNRTLPAGLPMALDGLGLTNCTAFTYDSIFLLPMMPPVMGGYLYLPVPRLTELVGADFLMQGHLIASGANAAGLVSTNALHLTIGD